ncbi:MAG: hypothetical protein KGI66_04195 [Patescibacteria group bacterium]|nr:hypothetical protein [Patescibacteria group bacterium]
MLYVFHGTDLQASMKKAHALVDSLRAKRPDAAYERMSADDWSASALEGDLGGQGLFSNKYIIFLDRLAENEEAKEALPDLIPAMKGSANILIVLEGKLSAELKKAVDKHAEKAVVSDLAVQKLKKPEFNIFALADAVGSRDPVKSWMIYRQAVDAGHGSEAIIGTLFWQLKSMALAANAKSASEAGLSPFVFSKSKKNSGNFSKEELGRLLSDLIVMYHEGHRGTVDLELAAERWLLSIKNGTRMVPGA